MAIKPAFTIARQVQQLKTRGMLFHNEQDATHYFSTISYYRLKGYWWDTQNDRVNHTFKPNTYFETIIERYNFDRHLRLILFDAIERVEIALRTKMIYHMSLKYGALWYIDCNLFNDNVKHASHLTHIFREFDYSQEIFKKEHKRKHPHQDPEAWKILEVVSMGTLSKLYKNLAHQIPEKTIIAKEMGLHIHSELSSWLEAIVYVRNIIAHHSRLWSRNMVKRPKDDIATPMFDWLDQPLTEVQKKKPFLIISTLVYLTNKVTPGHHIKDKLLELFNNHPDVPIYKLGFLNNWNNQAIWK
jgi:abortive infection bacteriophage resistance protein